MSEPIDPEQAKFDRLDADRDFALREKEYRLKWKELTLKIRELKFSHLESQCWERKRFKES